MSKSEDNELRAQRLDSAAKSHAAAANRWPRDSDLAENRLTAAQNLRDAAAELRRR